MDSSPWRLSDRYDPALVALADEHYPRQTRGSPQCIAPGAYVALVTADKTAGWVSLRQRYRSDGRADAWINTLFRKTGPGLASEMILDAVAHTRSRWPVVPSAGMFTFIDPGKIRHKRDPGRCYLWAGFRRIAVTPKGLIVLQLVPADMPAARPVPGTTGLLWDAASSF